MTTASGFFLVIFQCFGQISDSSAVIPTKAKKSTGEDVAEESESSTNNVPTSKVSIPHSPSHNLLFFLTHFPYILLQRNFLFGIQCLSTVHVLVICAPRETFFFFFFNFHFSPIRPHATRGHKVNISSLFRMKKHQHGSSQPIFDLDLSICLV